MLKYKLSYYWRHPVKFTKEIIMFPFNEIKWKYQRSVRGWSDKDSWSLNYYLSFILSTALLDLANKKYGSPCRNVDNFPECCKTCNCGDLWRKELKENAEKFRLLYKDDWYKDPIWLEEKTYKEATEWLAKWYSHLWW